MKENLIRLYQMVIAGDEVTLLISKEGKRLFIFIVTSYLVVMMNCVAFIVLTNAYSLKITQSF
jgi:hypothetical protein